MAGHKRQYRISIPYFATVCRAIAWYGVSSAVFSGKNRAISSGSVIVYLRSILRASVFDDFLDDFFGRVCCRADSVKGEYACECSDRTDGSCFSDQHDVV